MLILDVIRATAAQTPDKLAIGFNGRAIGYAAFWRMIAARRAALKASLRGTGLVLLPMTSVLEGWVAGLAARSLGFHSAVLRDTAQFDLFDGLDVAGVVTVDGEGWPAVPGFARSPRVNLPALDLDAPESAAPLPPSPRIRHPGGHVLLTSGTTGRPKKVLSRCGETAAATSMFGNGMVMPCASAVACVFDLGLWTGAGYWMPLWMWAGQGAVVIRQGPDWAQALAWPGLTTAVATPQYVANLLALPEDAFPFNENITLAITAGAVTPRMAAEARRRISPTLTINVSSTEVGTWGRAFVSGDEDLRWHRIDMGREVEVVDDDDRPLPPFKLGRVRLRLKPGAEQGYYGDGAPPAGVFVGEWFYPGDLGELDGKGRIALHGRSTDVVNIAGQKVPVSDWERTLADRLGAEGVCVLSGRWGDGQERLHVFIESRRAIAASTLSAAVNEVLWGFEGAHLHKVEALPRTPLGKIQRTVLARRLHDGAFGPDGGTLA